jgi:hypothetical protein
MYAVTKFLQEPQNWADTQVQPKMDLQEVGFGSMDWIELAEYRTGGGHL